MTALAEANGIYFETANVAAELEAQVQCRLSGRIHDFQLVVAGKGLVLRGRSRTYYVKQLAQHAVTDATGLPIQANEIEVSLAKRLRRGGHPSTAALEKRRVVMDRSLNVEGQIIFQAGTHADVVRLDFRDWYEMVKPQVATLSEQCEFAHAVRDDY